MQTPDSMVNNNVETSVIFDIIHNITTAMKQRNNIAADRNWNLQFKISNTKTRIKSLLKKNGKAKSHNLIKSTTNGVLWSLLSSPKDVNNVTQSYVYWTVHHCDSVACFSLQHGYHSNPTTPNLQHTMNQEQYDQCGNSTE